MLDVRRRQFITLLGGAAALPLGARAQQAPMPVIGVLSPTSAAGAVRNIAALRQGLRDLGYIEGRNLAGGLDDQGRHLWIWLLGAELVAEPCHQPGLLPGGGR